MTDFFDTSTASFATITSNADGATQFAGQSSAEGAVLIANGSSKSGEPGKIVFAPDLTPPDSASGSSSGAPTGDFAHVKVYGTGFLDISLLGRSRGISVGTIEGSGHIYLGSKNLEVTRGNTRFSGTISDLGIDPETGGSLSFHAKERFHLSLTHESRYTGGTLIKHGTLIVNNSDGSATGSGSVQINGGGLAGKGSVAGAVTVGKGNGSGATLSPGFPRRLHRIGALTVGCSLTFNADGVLQTELDSSAVSADEVIANGVTINNGAQLNLADLGNAKFPSGTRFTIINNTSANPIAGAFSNLSDGSTFSSNGNKYKANYEGGDGNDLTLTVVR